MPANQWFLDLPRRTQDRLSAFTPTRDGYARWYRGKTRFVCGKGTNPDVVEDRWQERKREIDAVAGETVRRSRDGVFLREAAGDFYAYLDHRVTTGQPEPLSPYTRADYIRILTAFGKCIGGGNRIMADIGPADFTKFAKELSDQSPSTVARNVANVRAFFQWCKDEGLISSQPQYGRYFIRPSQQKHRDKRIDQEKSYTPEEVRRLWDAADQTERTWIALGLNGALDNADLSNLTAGLIDWGAGTIDYRRRKTGKGRRIIPIRPELAKLLREYKRPDPTPGNEHLFFVTPTGNPLGRVKESTSRPGFANAIDYVSQRWRRLMVRAGLREKPIVLASIGRGAKRRRRVKFVGKPDGRGFRSLRTTFVNSVPVGYGDERDIIMGHLRGGVLVENYLERFGVARLRECVDHVWDSVFTSPPPPDAKPRHGKAAAAQEKA